MRLRSLLVAAFVVGVVLAPIEVAQADPPVQCTAVPTGGGGGAVHADVRTQFNYDVPEGVSSVLGTAAVQSYPSWGLDLDNLSSAAISSPMIAVDTGLDPSVFDGELPASGSCGLASLPAGQDMQVATPSYPVFTGSGLTARGIQSAVSLGYDSSISGPTLIPVGGGDATERFTVTITNPDLVGENGIGIRLSGLGNGGVEVVSRADPTNIDQGETVVEDSFAGNGWTLLHPQLDKSYVFTAVVHVDNDANYCCGGIGPLLFQPFGDVSVGAEVGSPQAGSSVTVPDPSIDGSFTFSVDAPDSIQVASHEIEYVTHYPFLLSDRRSGSITSTLSANVPAGANGIASGSALSGVRSWSFALSGSRFTPPTGQAATTVTTPSISVRSGYDPSQLDPNGGAPAAALPIVFSGPTVTVDPNLKQEALEAYLGSTAAATLRPGCDTSRSVSPLIVPVGGGEQTVTLTVRCTDPLVREVDVTEQLPVAGATLVSFTGPSDGWAPDIPTDASAGFGFGDGIQTGTAYTFTAVVQVANPYGQPFVDAPLVGVTEDMPRGDGCTNCGGPFPQTSASIAVPSLDGPTSGAGVVTFATGDPKEWQIGAVDQNQYTYGSAAGPFSADQCKRGGWQAFGIFKNQGDCVSYVATGGKNPPSGG